MSKRGSHDSFGHLKHKLWQKKRSRVKLVVWLPTTKSWESTRLPCMQVACNIQLKSFRWGLQLCFKSHFIQKSVHKVMGPQSRGSPGFGNFGSPNSKCHLGVSLVDRHRVYYKGEGGGFPQIWAVVSLVNPSLPVAHPSTKNAPTMH
jgi:hypothetical protein